MSGEAMYVLTIDMKQHSISYNSSGTVALVAHHFHTVLYKLRMANVQQNLLCVYYNLQDFTNDTTTWPRTQLPSIFSPAGSRGRLEGHADWWVNSQDGENSGRDTPDSIPTDQPGRNSHRVTIGLLPVQLLPSEQDHRAYEHVHAEVGANIEWRGHRNRYGDEPGNIRGCHVLEEADGHSEEEGGTADF